MKLTVDACIAVKWLVSEDLCHEARTVLARRIERCAPELLLAECANTIWKKARQGEIPDSRPYRQELADLPDIVTLRPDRGLVERATQMAFELAHPVYDCLYLACAEATATALVTADKRFVDKVAGQYADTRVYCIGTPGVADWIETTGTAPVIGPDKLEALARAYDLCAKTEQSVAESLPGGSAEIPVPTLDTPASRRLANLISKLNDEELIDLLACGWFGTADFPTWRESFEYAERAFTNLAPRYVTGYGHRWRSGYSRAMAGVEAVAAPIRHLR